MAAIPFLSCLQDYPMVRPGEFTDVRANLSVAQGLAKYDSIQVEIHAGRDSGRVISTWTVGGDSLPEIPLQFRPKGEALLIKIRGYLDSIGYCYMAWYEDKRLLSSVDSCDLIPKILEIKELSPADTTVSIHDSVVFQATVSSRNGILAGYQWDFNGDGAQNPGGPLTGAMASVSAGWRAGNKAGAFPVRLLVHDADSNQAFKVTMVAVVMDPPIVKLGPDTNVDLGDSLTLKGSGTDGIGRIIAAGWQALGDTTTLGNGERLVVSGKELGARSYLFHVVDDDGLTAWDTITVTTTNPDSNATLRAIYPYPGTLDPVFSPSRSDYKLSVPAKTDSLKLTARPASGKSTVTLLDFAGAAAIGDLFVTIPFLQQESQFRIRVRSVSGRESEYRIAVARDSGNSGLALGYARVPDPASAGPVLGISAAYNSAGRPVQFNRSGPGRYRITFPALGAGAGEGNVQATAYGGIPGQCGVASWGGADFSVDLACANAKGEFADLPFGVSAIWPRPHSNGGNAFISNDIVPTESPQKAKAASAYNSFNGAAQGAITVLRAGPGMTATTFIGLNTGEGNQGNALVTLHGTGPGWCRIVDLNSAGADVVATTTCFLGAGAPSDGLFSLSTVFPTLGASDFGIGYAIAPGPVGFADSLPDPAQAYNSTGGGVTARRLGTGRFQVAFPGLGANGGDRTGVVQVSAYGDTGTGYCQVEEWKPSEAVAVILCSDTRGLPEDSRFSIRVIR